MLQEIEKSKYVVKHIDGVEGLRLLPDKSVKLVYGSPPYPNAERDYGVWKSSDYIDKIAPFLDACCLKLRDDGFIVINVKANREKATSKVSSKRSLIIEKLAVFMEEKWHLHCVDIEIWIKENPVPTGLRAACQDAYEQNLWFSKAPKWKINLDAIRRPYESHSVKTYESYEYNELSRYGQIEDLTQRDREVTNGLADCLQKIDNTKNGIIKTKERIKAAETAIATLNDKIRRTATTDTDLQLAIKKAELCEGIHAIFEEGIAAYRDKLKQDVERDATELFLLICSDPDYTSLKINDNYGLDIVHRSGRIVPQRSAGYEHIVALSLIGALHKNAPMNGPVIMDSPFGRLSKTHKENVIKALPKMAEQVVLLAYNGEIDAQTARLTLGSELKQEYRLDKISSFHTDIIPQ